MMKGRVYDRTTNQPLSGVMIINTLTKDVYQTDSTGTFHLKVGKGQLIEFRAPEYQLAQVRIDNDTHLPFYSIGLHKGAYTLPAVEVTGHNFKSDSVENAETYKWAINHYDLKGLDVIAHPFDALSKRNRQIWAFQKQYQYFEKEKFIDFVFNDELITKITGLHGDALQSYKRAYRPQYFQIQEWTTYEFYEYIKYTGLQFKNN